MQYKREHPKYLTNQVPNYINYSLAEKTIYITNILQDKKFVNIQLYPFRRRDRNILLHLFHFSVSHKTHKEITSQPNQFLSFMARLSAVTINPEKASLQALYSFCNRFATLKEVVRKESKIESE